MSADYTLHRQPHCAGCAQIKALTAVADGDMATCRLDGKVWIRRATPINPREVVRSWELATRRERRRLAHLEHDVPPG